MPRDRSMQRVASIRGLLLDKDGTILDYWRTWLPINRQVALFAASGDAELAADLLRLGGHDPDTDRVTAGSALAAGSLDDIAAAFATRLGSAAPPDFVASIDRIFREGGARHAVAVDGAAAALEDLARRGFALGVATNDSMAGLEASLACCGLAHYFGFSAGCDTGHGAKPDPGMAQAFCRATGLSPREVAVVGDAVHDLEMGRRAGLGLLIGVLTGTSGRADLEPHADVIIDSITDLPELLGSAVD
jgi:phosphoglycolate phosphatase